jgi:anthranilate synthase component 1
LLERKTELSIFTRSYLSDTETPVSLFGKLKANFPLAFLFESADRDRQAARFSIIGIDPVLGFRLKDGQAEITDFTQNAVRVETVSDPFARLKTLQTEVLPQVARLPEKLSDLPLTAGWVGYLGFGMTQYFERIPQQETDVLNVPDAYMALYDSMIIFDHFYHRIHFVSHRDAAQAERLAMLVTSAMAGQLTGQPTRPLPFDEPSDAVAFDHVETSVTREQFLDSVEQARQYIIEGQAFQIVVAQRFSLPVQAQPLDIYRMVTALNPSPYAYYLQFPDFTYVGSSPETFVRCRNGEVTLKALAGTRPRGETPNADQQLEQDLVADRKEMAEHRMLVDLGRNDLGRVCRPGSIRVGEIAQVIRYAHVMHLSTEIKGTLQENRTGYDMVRACFPRGTLSGAPKIRALQLLSRLEPERRGVYSGMVGYLDPLGNTDGAIAIRSALIKDGMAHVHAGAGVVYHSRPDSEYEETRNKARSMLKAIQMAERTVAHAQPAASSHH